MCYVEQLLVLLAPHQLGHFSYVMSERIQRVSLRINRILLCRHFCHENGLISRIKEREIHSPDILLHYFEYAS